MGHPTGEFNNFNPALYFTRGIIQCFAVFVCNCFCQKITILVHQFQKCKHHTRTFDGRDFRPFNLESNFISLPISLALISLLLVPVLRTWRLGAAFVLPNLLPMGVGFGLWALWSGEVNFTMAIVLYMTVGIIVDDTIHFIAKYLRARREQDLAPEDAIRYSFHNVGGALVVNTLILTAGFLILAQSAFLPNSGMAQLTAATIVAALIIDLTLLPAMLLRLDRAPTPKSATEEISHAPLPAK
jgi:multidrug efflux pump subunit AcrB